MSGQGPNESFELGHFDEFGQFVYNKAYFGQDEDEEGKKKRHIDLKDLSKQDFLDLTEAKNQDKRFYHWLHMHPLFDDDWDKEGAP